MGAVAIRVAMQSARDAKRSLDREDDRSKRQDRHAFGLLATEWLTAAVDELFHPSIDDLFEAPDEPPAKE